MKYLFPILSILFIFISDYLFSAAELSRDTNDASSRKFILTVTEGSKSVSRDVYLTGADNPAPVRIVYIFHGLKTANDAYQQSPVYFISNWNLSTLAEKYGILFVLADNGSSVYPVTKLKDPLSDMSVMNALKKEIDSRYKPSKADLSIGFSAGVEGAVKFAIINHITEIMAISGNYDLFHLPPGEKAFHEKGYGKGNNIVVKENPITLLRNQNKIIYLFCEEKNDVNVRQAQTLVAAQIPGIRLIDLRSLGK
jgi:hypothetical protein